MSDFINRRLNRLESDLKKHLLAGDYRKAVKHLEDLHRLFVWYLEQSDSPLQRNFSEKFETACRLNRLAKLSWLLGQTERAVDLLDRAVAVSREEASFNRSDLAVLLGNLAEAHRAAGRLREAENASREALEILDDFFGSDHPKYLKGLCDLLKIYDDLKSLDPKEDLPNKKNDLS